MLVRNPKPALSPVNVAPTAASPVAGNQLVLRIRGGEHHGRVVQLSALECSLGSAEGNTLRLRCQGVEPRHAKLLRGGEGCRVEALGEVYLNGAPIHATLLRRGDLLSIGPVEFEVLNLGFVERRNPPAPSPQISQPPPAPLSSRLPSPIPRQLPPPPKPAETPTAPAAQIQPPPENISASVQQRLSELESLLSVEAERSGTYHRERDAAAQEVSELQQALAKLRTGSANLTQERDQLRETLSQRQLESTRLAAQLQHEQSLLASAQQAASQAAEKLVAWQQQFQAEQQRLTTQVSQLESQLAARDQAQAMLVSDYQYREEATTAHASQLAQHLAELDSALVAAQKQLQDAGNDQKQAAGERERLISERDALKHEQQSLLSRNSDLAAELERRQTLAAEASSRQEQFQAEIVNLTEQLTSLTASVQTADARAVALEAERQLLQESTQSLQKALDEAQAALEHSCAHAAAEITARQTAHEQKVAELETANAALQSRLYEESQQAQRQGEESVTREIELAAQAQQAQRAYADLQLEFRLAREREAAAQADLLQQLADANHIIAARSLDLEQQQQASSDLARELAQTRADLETQQAELARQAERAQELRNQHQFEQQQAEEQFVSLRTSREQALAELASSRAENELCLQELTASLERERSERNARETELAAQLHQSRQATVDAETHAQFNAERQRDELHRLTGALLTAQQGLQTREQVLEQLRCEQERQNANQQEELAATREELHRLQQLRQKEAEGWTSARRGLEAESNKLARELTEREQQWNAIRFTIDNTNLEQQCELGRLQGELTELKARIKSDRDDFSKVRARLEAEAGELADQLFQKTTQLRSVQGLSSATSENHRREAEALRSELNHLRQQFDAELARWTQERSALQGDWTKRLETAQLQAREQETAHRAATTEVARLTGVVELLRSEVTATAALLRDDDNRRLAERTEWEGRLQKVAAELCDKQLEMEQLRGEHAVRQHQGASEIERLQRELTAHKAQAEEQQRLLAELNRQLEDRLAAAAVATPEPVSQEASLAPQVQTLTHELELARDELVRLAAVGAANLGQAEAASARLQERETELASLQEASAVERESFTRQLAELQETSNLAQTELTRLREELALVNTAWEESRAAIQAATMFSEQPSASERADEIAEADLQVAAINEPATSEPNVAASAPLSPESHSPGESSPPVEDWSTAEPNQTICLPRGSLDPADEAQEPPPLASANLFTAPAGGFASPSAPAQTDNDDSDPEFEARLARLLGRTVGKASETFKPQPAAEPMQLVEPATSDSPQPSADASEAAPGEEPASEAVVSEQPVLSIMDRLKQSGVWKEPEPNANAEAAPPCTATLNLPADRKPFAAEALETEEEAKEQIAAPVQVAAHSPSSPAHSGEGDEESIDDYMSRLLNRMRGGAPAPAQPTKEKPKPAPVQQQPQAQALPPEPQAPQAPQEPTEFVPRAAAPEKADSLKAMREVANSAARGAIAVHSRERTKMTLAGRMVAGILTLIIALVAVGVGVQSRSLPALVGGLIGLLLGGSWLLTSCLEGIRSARLQPPRHD